MGINRPFMLDGALITSFLSHITCAAHTDGSKAKEQGAGSIEPTIPDPTT